MMEAQQHTTVHTHHTTLPSKTARALTTTAEKWKRRDTTMLALGAAGEGGGSLADGR